MTIVNKPTAELKPYDKNAKKHDKKQIANVAESIKQFGFVQPIVLDKDNNVIIGHCRLEAAKKLHLAEVPCVMADDLTDKQVKKLRLLDNKLNESDWDIDLIAEEIADLDFDRFDVDWGIEQTAEDLIEDTEPEDESPIDKLPESKLYFVSISAYGVEGEVFLQKSIPQNIAENIIKKCEMQGCDFVCEKIGCALNDI